MNRLLSVGLVSAVLVLLFSAPAQAAFTLNPTSLALPDALAGGAPVSDTVTLTNLSSSSLTVTLNSNKSWLSASISPNPVSGNGTATITVTANPATLNPGDYTGTVTVSGGGTSAYIDVTLHVSGVTITASPNVISSSLQVGGHQSTQVHITGFADVQISVSGGAWLSASPSSFSAPGNFNVDVDASTLSAGNNYSGSVTVQCVNGSPCVPVSIAVLINVVEPPALQVSKNTLVFQVNAGAMSATQTISVTSNAGSLPFSTSANPWIIVNPVSGTATTTPQSLKVSIDATSLSAGAHTGTIAFSCGTDCSPLYIDVTANVVGAALTAAPPSLSFYATPLNGTLPPSQTVNVKASDSESFSLTYSPQGSWLKVTADQTATPAVLTVSIVSIPPQTSTGSITITPASGSGPINVPVTLTVINGTTPFISPNGIQSAGDFGAFSSITPGTYIEIYGLNLSSTNPGRTWSCGDFTNNCQNAPTSLDGTTVTVGNEKAFVYYVSPSQLDALVPSDIGTGPTQVTVTNSGGTSNGDTLTVNPVQPGLLAPASFRINGKQYVAALFTDGQTFALPVGAIPGVPSRPAKPGDTLLIYGIGFGPVTPPIPAGTVVSQQNTLATPLQMLFGTTPATLSYKGLAPGTTGEYQFNVQVPPVADNDAVPLTFNLGGVAGTQTLYIAVHQ